MPRRRRDETKAADSRAGENAEALVRAAAQAIAKRHGGTYAAPEELAADEELVKASKRLADPGVPFETVERLARASNVIVAAIAHRATGLREDVPATWIPWAYQKLTKVYAGELLFLLQAIERHGETPFIARVLARADHDWSEGWQLEVVRAFVERRVQAGERPTAAEFDEHVAPEKEELVANVVAELEGALPQETYDELGKWRRRRAQLRLFGSIGRVWESLPDEPTLLTAGGRSDVVARLQERLRKQGSRSALLVGSHGVGKSAVIREALEPFRDEGWVVFEAGATDVNAGQSYIGSLEGRIREMVEAASEGDVVWVFPSFEEALWAGQHRFSPQGMLDSLLPYVDGGRLSIVGELEPASYDRVVQERRRVASAFEILRLEPLSRAESIAVARDWRDRVGADIDDETIDQAQELTDHFLAGVAAPARLLRQLKAARTDCARAGREQIRGRDVLETLAQGTGLPLHVIDPESPLDLHDVRRFFSARVLGQPEAIDCLVDRIALIKANLTDPTRPLGVFLFVGPTGTGKTEIAKTLAEFLFGSPDRLVRLDMSEFQTEASFERLLGDSNAEGEAASLISAVRSKPFSVVLLDEFEKAHSNIWSLFLQLFDDGRLTDRQGRTADFRQCVVILTSNAGAAVEGRSMGFGGDGAPFRPAAVERGLSRVFRPELLNRIDRVVVFRPFERGQIRALLERELAQILDRRGLRRREWAVEFDESALEFLEEKGFSRELGARPLKRAVERYLLAPLAAAIVSRSFPEGEQFLFITARDDSIEVAFVDPDIQVVESPAPRATTALRLERLVLEPRGGREESEFLQEETERLRQVIDGEGWLGLKERDLEAMRAEAFWESQDRFDVLARIEYVDRVQASLRTAEKLASRLSRLSQNGRGSAREVVELLAERLYLLDHACTQSDASAPADAFLDVRPTGSDHSDVRCALQLRDMYEAWARRRRMRVQRLSSSTGHLLVITGIGAYGILSAETGLHVFESPHGEHSFDRATAYVAVAPSGAAPPGSDPVVSARRALAEVPTSTTVVRRYREKPSPLVRDAVRNWRTGRLDRVLAGEFDVMADS